MSKIYTDVFGFGRAVSAVSGLAAGALAIAFITSPLWLLALLVARC